MATVRAQVHAPTLSDRNSAYRKPHRMHTVHNTADVCSNDLMLQIDYPPMQLESRLRPR